MDSPEKGSVLGKAFPCHDVNMDKPTDNNTGQTDIEHCHYDDVIMTMLASQITSLTVVYSIVYSGVNQRKHQSSASLAFVREIHRGPVNFPHKWPVTRKMFPFDDVIMAIVVFSMLCKHTKSFHGKTPVTQYQFCQGRNGGWHMIITVIKRYKYD